MTKSELIEQIRKKRTFLCIGLDTDIKKIPKYLLEYEDPIFEFNKLIIDSTKDLCIAYKPNLAFYESLGVKGMLSLQKTIEYIPSDIFTIADAKRGDIGNTSNMYALTFFNKFNFDSITLSPYMGKDSIVPFLSYKDKWVILLALTSNSGANDFQKLKVKDKFLFEKVIEVSSKWGSDENIMYVVGATKSEKLVDIRKLIPDNFLLVPGIGAQGGDLNKVAKNGMNDQCGLIINASRSIIYASQETDFYKYSRTAAKKIQQQMEKILNKRGI